MRPAWRRRSPGPAVGRSRRPSRRARSAPLRRPAAEPTAGDLTYDDLVQGLFPRLTGGIRWGLERTERLLATAGDPHRAYPVVHVGGTNGKGSVAATTASILRAAGLRTGLYTSPHLCSFRERVRVDGEPIDEAALLAAAGPLWPAIQSESASFFEATTVIAFEALARAGVDVAVVEVGLGGRLDSTNVVSPAVVALTNVALDHADYLGETLDAIAAEKAGIIKAGVPVVTTESRPETLELFRARASAVGAPRPAVLGGDDLRGVSTGLGGTRLRLRTEAWGELDLHTPLIGRHQAENTGLAVWAAERLPEWLRPSAEAVRRGVAAVRWPGRLQVERVDGATWVFDAAHNPAAIERLLATLGELALPRPLVAVVSILRDKAWASMLAPLARAADAVLVTRAPTAPADRAWDPWAALSSLAGGPDEARVRAVAELEDALREATVAAAGGSVLVTGSFHTVGDALALLGRPPGGVRPDLPPSARVV